jgi:DNA sulfur modification protein DndC
MLPSIPELVARGALFVVNHSGGKDSQAMFHAVRRSVPDAQIVVIHAELPGVEWEGTWQHVQATTLGLPCYIVRAGKTLLGMVEARGMFPSPTLRQCTSDLKRGPIEKQIRAIVKATGRNIVVNCMGLRAEESSARAKQQEFRFNDRNSKAGREWYDWLPIHDWKVGQVWAEIAAAGQEPHWAYGAGMSRLSCCFCIMSSEADLKTAGRLMPALAREYMALERRLDVTMLMPSKTHGRRFLDELLDVPAA